jgi:hypothetical protein
MPVGEALLLLFLALLGVGGVSYGVVRWDQKRAKKRAQLQGERNAQKILKGVDVCFRCNVPIDPSRDVYHRGSMKRGTWWCEPCFKEIIQ